MIQSNEIAIITADMRKSAIEFGRRLAPAMQEVVKSLNRFGASVYIMAEREYMRHHRHLPGSDRTKRLRKKRRMIVLEWFFGTAKELHVHLPRRSGRVMIHEQFMKYRNVRRALK